MRCEICGMEHPTKHLLKGIEESEAFIALITPHYVFEPWHHEEIRYAQKLGKPLFAVVEREVEWDEYKDYPWVKVFEFDRHDVEQGRLSSYKKAVEEIDGWLKTHKKGW